MVDDVSLKFLLSALTVSWNRAARLSVAPATGKKPAYTPICRIFLEIIVSLENSRKTNESFAVRACRALQKAKAPLETTSFRKHRWIHRQR